MLYRNCIEKLLQLKDVIVTNIECSGEEMHIHLRMEQRLHRCPQCGTLTSKVHDYRTQLVRDVSISGYATILHLRKRRHVCPNCGKRFDEYIDFLPRYRQFTNRVFLQILGQLKECRSIKGIAADNNMSPPTAAKIVNEIDFRVRKLPEVLAIDEFKGNAEGEKFQCILADPKNRRVVDILPTRKHELFPQAKIKASTSREEAAKRLSWWIMDAQRSGLKDMIKISLTYQNWSIEILNSFEYPYTNGYIEGCNNRIKVLKRVSFGMPRFVRFRRRIMHIMVD